MFSAENSDDTPAGNTVFCIMLRNMHIIFKDINISERNIMMLRKPMATALFFYILAVTGVWTFLNACGNSYNRLSAEKIKPFSASADSEKAEIQILGKTFGFDVSGTAPESGAWLIFYLAVPDDVRISCCISYYIVAFLP